MPGKKHYDNKTILLGDLTIHRIGLGSNRVTDTKETRAVLKHAIELGINFIDTADIYTGGASEQTIGDTLAPYPKVPSPSGRARWGYNCNKGGMVASAPDNKPEYLEK
jgi:hypothetical protein